MSFFLILYGGLNAQGKTSSMGFGTSATLFFQQNPYYPQLPLTPYLTLRINKNEFLCGSDFYTNRENNFKIAGVQAAYRYHFLREHKRNNVFIELNSQYVQFKDGCGAPGPYYSTTYGCFDGDVYKNKSIFNALGLGAELYFSKRFYFYSVAGVGIKYTESVVYRAEGFPSSDSKHTGIYSMAYFKMGLSYNFVARKKNACDSCPK